MNRTLAECGELYGWEVDQSIGLPSGGAKGSIWSEEERVSVGE